MFKSVFYSILFLLSFATLILAQRSGSRGGGGRGGGSRGGGNRGGSGAEDYTYLKLCYNDCNQMPVPRGDRMSKFLCKKRCDSIHNPGPKSGCHKNYCWASCTGSSFGEEWCYTSTASYSQSYTYVPCQNDDECNPDWRCGGSCTI